jgi:thiosulfate dehydrogenase
MNVDNRTALRTVTIASGLIGAVIFVGVLLVGRPASFQSDGLPVAATPEYGRQLLRDTAAFIGPDHEDPEMRFSGSRIACASCHLDTGMEPGTLSLFESASRYPRFSGRDGGVGDLRDRINGCMQRSMNGRPLPRDSVEMIAMESYILSLADQFAATAESKRLSVEPPEFIEPDRAADVTAGQLVFEDKCQLCHGTDGAGLMATADPSDGYVFPPLWGPDSFNNGAGMNRVLTAARFIKARMPYGQPDLTDDQAYDVAAYINAQPRPEMQGLDADYPDRSLKPVDSPYPPYADPFPREQHRFGPFGPIREYYEAESRD